MSLVSVLLIDKFFFIQLYILPHLLSRIFRLQSHKPLLAKYIPKILPSNPFPPFQAQAASQHLAVLWLDPSDWSGGQEGNEHKSSVGFLEIQQAETLCMNLWGIVGRNTSL